MDPNRQEWQRLHARNNPSQERNSHQRHQHHSSLPNNSQHASSGPLGAHLQDQQPRARIISLPAYKRHSSAITAGALNKTLEKPSDTPAGQSLHSHDQYSRGDSNLLHRQQKENRQVGHDHGTRPARYASSGSNTTDPSDSDRQLKKGSGQPPVDTASHHQSGPTRNTQPRRIPSPARTYSTTPQYNPSHMSESEESDHASPSAVPRTVLHAHEYDRVRHPQGHASRRSRQRSRQTSSSTHDWSDEDSRGNVRMARRESITSSFATTRTLPPPNISRIARLNVGTLDRTDLKLRIQELKSSLASRQRPVEDAQKTATEQGLELHRDESEDRSVTVAESDISSSIHNRDSTLERSHEIEVADREDLNMIDGGTSESMVNYGDEVRYDLRNIRDEIHDMLAALERSKMESRQLQQWVVERSELERQLREEWSTTNTEAQRVLLQQQRQIELASQRTSSHGFHDSRASRRHTSTSRSREHTSSQEAKESSIDDLSSDSTPPPNLAKKRNRTHLLIRRSNIKEFEQDVSASDASSEYRDPDKPENPATGLEKIADEGNEGVLPTMNRQRGHVRSFPWRVIRICFWILFTLALHILLMGLLFRPIALVEDRSVIGKNSREHRAPFIRYKGRDYISGQPGFYTFLSDGFGTDSLAYCHDMVHYPGHEDKSWGSSFLRYVLDGIDHAHERWASLPKVSWNGPLQQLHAHWSPLADRIKHMTRRKNKDDTLDWVFAEQQVQAQ